MSTTTQISAPQWQALQQKRVVFGHQSVGENILEGIERIAARNDAKIAIREQRTALTGKGISHFLIGKNGDPLSKIHDFAGTVDAGAAQGADVALMKLCFDDFNAATDARKVADAYIANLDYLTQKYPEVNFAAVTAPLTAAQTGPKAWIKRLIGKQPSGYLDNAKRAEFNTLLRKQYQQSGRLFDVAKAETGSTGKYCSIRVDGREVETLCPELTNDGGHLNERGQDLVAAAFLNFVNSLSTQATK